MRIYIDINIKKELDNEKIKQGGNMKNTLSAKTFRTLLCFSILIYMGFFLPGEESTASSQKTVSDESSDTNSLPGLDVEPGLSNITGNFGIRVQNIQRVKLEVLKLKPDFLYDLKEYYNSPSPALHPVLKKEHVAKKKTVTISPPPQLNVSRFYPLNLEKAVGDNTGFFSFRIGETWQKGCDSKSGGKATPFVSFPGKNSLYVVHRRNHDFLLKGSADNFVIWAYRTPGKDGIPFRPLGHAPVTVIGTSKTTEAGKTSADGLLLGNSPLNVGDAVVVTDPETGAVAFYIVNKYNLPRMEVDAYIAAIHTDRRSYSPGDRVHVFGAVRKRNRHGKLTLTPPSSYWLNLNVSMDLTSYKNFFGKNIREAEVRTDSFGTFHYSFKPAADMPKGKILVSLIPKEKKKDANGDEMRIKGSCRFSYQPREKNRRKHEKSRNKRDKAIEAPRLPVPPADPWSIVPVEPMGTVKTVGPGLSHLESMVPGRLPGEPPGNGFFCAPEKESRTYNTGETITFSIRSRRIGKALITIVKGKYLDVRLVDIGGVPEGVPVRINVTPSYFPFITINVKAVYPDGTRKEQVLEFFISSPPRRLHVSAEASKSKTKPAGAILDIRVQDRLNKGKKATVFVYALDEKYLETDEDPVPGMYDKFYREGLWQMGLHGGIDMLSQKQRVMEVTPASQIRRLRPAKPLTGLVTNAYGDPLPGTRVTASMHLDDNKRGSASRYVYTGSDGRYHFGPVSRYVGKLLFTKKGFKPLKLTPAAWSGKYPAVVSLDSRMGLDPERIEKKPFFNPNPGIYRPPAAIGFNHTISGDRMINGVIFDTISDKPLNYVTITITNAITGQSTDTPSDMDGMFCFSGLPSGVYNFKLKSDYVDNYKSSKNIILNRADLTLKLKQCYSNLSVEQVVTGLKAKESERNVLFLPGDIDYSSKRKNSRGVLFFEALET
ncbi:MAG: hypothetical protein GY757_00990, partial [bacterium]|nr:hypothetical protein [bacterium]